MPSRLPLTALAFATLALSATPLVAQQPTPATRLERDVRNLMHQADVPGLTAARFLPSRSW
jgi:hypothetical protein